MKVKSESEVAQSCSTPSDPMDHSLPGSSVHGIFQTTVLEWVAIAFSDMCLHLHIIKTKVMKFLTCDKTTSQDNVFPSEHWGKNIAISQTVVFNFHKETKI